MSLKAILMSGVAVAWAIGLSGGAHAADNKEVQMLHWWTSGGEAAALNVIKQALAKQGYGWKDVPVAGGGGGAAMTTLKAMVAAGNPPTASLITFSAAASPPDVHQCSICTCLLSSA